MTPSQGQWWCSSVILWWLHPLHRANDGDTAPFTGSVMVAPVNSVILHLVYESCSLACEGVRVGRGWEWSYTIKNTPLTHTQLSMPYMHHTPLTHIHSHTHNTDMDIHTHGHTCSSVMMECGMPSVPEVETGRVECTREQPRRIWFWELRV